MGNIGTKEARKVHKFQYNKSTTMTTTLRRTHMHGTIPGIRNAIQKEMSINTGQDKKLDKFFNNNNCQETTQLLHRQLGSLYEIGSLKAVGYNGHDNVYSGSNDIHLDRQSPRRLKDFWSIIIDTGAAVSVCPMTC
eukprot:3286056-Amphidinium_carterae.1